MNKITPKKALRSLNTYRPAIAENKKRDIEYGDYSNSDISSYEGSLSPARSRIGTYHLKQNWNNNDMTELYSIQGDERRKEGLCTPLKSIDSNLNIIKQVDNLNNKIIQNQQTIKENISTTQDNDNIKLSIDSSEV